MAVATYNELITATFRDNAIRSVMMIDDDFVPYDELYDLAPGSEKFIESRKAASIHRFFQEKTIICDIDKGAFPIKVDRIRKCDLVILDYHLEHQNPTRSIGLIKDLAATANMNLVVVYTREPLEKTWFQIGASLLGTKTTEDIFRDSAEAFAYWEDQKDEHQKSWDGLLSSEDLVSYFTRGCATQSTTDEFTELCGEYGQYILAELCENRFRDFNIAKTTHKNTTFTSKYGKNKWHQIGNVFVVLHEKSREDVAGDPQGIWAALENALIDWHPSYYRLLISEMQNQLENEPIYFSPNLEHDLAGQVAWLDRILNQNNDNDKNLIIEQLFDRLTDELKGKLFKNTAMQELISGTFAALRNDCKTDILSFAAKHVGLEVVDDMPMELHVNHALNFTLCAQSFDGEYVTNGTVLYDINHDKWYLCVAPACETVPKQTTENTLAARLVPHRFMKVLVLQKVAALRKALKIADRSNTIFIKDRDGNRIALEVINDTTKQPVIDYILIKDHDSSSNDICKNGLTASLLETHKTSGFIAKEATLVPIWQLRDVYAARFQAAASHHTGRVGVDFVKFK